MRWLGLLLVSGCVVSTEQSSSALETGSALSVDDSGMWFRKVGCPSPDPSTCLREANFWIDLRIRNDAYDKRIGIVWTDRVRNTAWQVATASYEHSHGDGFETWGVDVSTGVIGGNEPHPQIQFAAFVTMNGVTTWANNAGADYVIE